MRALETTNKSGSQKRVVAKPSATIAATASPIAKTISSSALSSNTAVVSATRMSATIGGHGELGAVTVIESTRSGILVAISSRVADGVARGGRLTMSSPSRFARTAPTRSTVDADSSLGARVGEADQNLSGLRAPQTGKSHPRPLEHAAARGGAADRAPPGALARLQLQNAGIDRTSCHGREQADAENEARFTKHDGRRHKRRGKRPSTCRIDRSYRRWSDRAAASGWYRRRRGSAPAFVAARVFSETRPDRRVERTAREKRGSRQLMPGRTPAG